jgi:hypothetical protein
VLATALREFRVEVVEPKGELRPDPSFSFRPAEELFCRLHPR